MTSPEGTAPLSTAATDAHEALSVLERWLRELRSDLAAETLLSRPSVRRAETAIADLEDLVAETRSALVLLALAFTAAPDVSACRALVVDRCREILATWRAGMEDADSRKADHARDFFARFMPRLADVLEQIVGSLSSRRREVIRDEQRAEEERRLLASPDLPVM